MCEEENKEKEAPTRLAIGVEGGFSACKQKYNTVKTHSLAVVSPEDAGIIYIPLPDATLPEYVTNVCAGVIAHEGMQQRMAVSSWEADAVIPVSKHAAGLEQQNNGKRISNDPSTWRCEASGDTSNLWLNLSTGYIGGGRRFWDGSGGSGAALQHYLDTGKKYPLCVKLGTITPHGADVWSYDDDEDCLVQDPDLAKHLSHWGIDIMKLEKTDQSLTEMEVAMNMNYDWSKMLDCGEALETVRGAGFNGLINIGSSCYMNSVLQVLFSIPQVQERYGPENGSAIRDALPSSTLPTDDLATQLAKLGRALLTTTYTPPSEEEADMIKYELAPRMLKQIVAKNHREFSSNRQQDAVEYLQHLLSKIAQAERVLLPKLASPLGLSTPLPTNRLFEFEVQQRYQCNVTGMVKYVTGEQALHNVMELRLPHNDNSNSDLGKRKLQESEEDAISFGECLASYFADESVQLTNPAVGGTVEATKRSRLSTFPPYLVMKLGRYYVDKTWTIRKISAPVAVPEVLDLTSWRASPPADSEVLIPDGDVAPLSSNSNTPNSEVVAQLSSMGFSEVAAGKAALATGNSDPEAAMNWLLEHMEDPDINTPAPSAATPANASGANEEDIGTLMSLGYSKAQVERALGETNYNVERLVSSIYTIDHTFRAADWLFSHPEELDAMMDVTETSQVNVQKDICDGEGKYELMAIISHLGKSTDCGHYICHVKRDEQWYVFNDEKVAKASSPPLSHGFVYIFRRCDQN